MPKASCSSRWSGISAWRCAYCTATNRGRSDCSCGGPRVDGFSLRTRAGDWLCNWCDTNNFSKRTECWGCQRAKGMLPPPPPPPPTAEEIAEEVAKRKKREEDRKREEEEKKKKDEEDEERRWELHRLCPDAQPF